MINTNSTEIINALATHMMMMTRNTKALGYNVLNNKSISKLRNFEHIIAKS
jgi:hypothetical protein